MVNKSLSPKLIWNKSRLRLRFGSCLREDKVLFTPKNVVNLFIVYKLDTFSQDLNTDFTRKDFLFGAVKLTSNADPDRYKYSGYGLGSDSRSEFSFTDGSMGKNFNIFGADMSSSVHIDNKGKDVLLLAAGPTKVLDDTTLSAEAQYSINFSRSNRKFCLVNAKKNISIQIKRF